MAREVSKLARRVGQYLRQENEHFSWSRVEHKQEHDYVSYVDKTSEQMLVEALSELLPEAGFLTEEGTAAYDGQPYCWVIDPLDGTTNFMLTKMKRENMGFDAALKIAQQLGYAETKDPGDDVDGRDACRKIAILASLACGHHVYPDNIPARGIRDVTVEDVKAAEQLDCAIKLIAWYHENPEGAADAFSAGVEPMLVPESNQLAGVNDVFNAVLMQGDMLGDVVFYGKGAGKLPTASAVVADVIDALKDGSKIHDSLFWKPAEKLDHQLMDTAKYSYYIRTAGVPAAALPNVAGPGKLVFDYGDSAAYLIEAATAADLEAVEAKLKVLGGRLALVLKKLPE